ncbi:MAG: hypothetical protein NUW01_02740 [Gemmatimonadaceae bacterium]|nr:hypothetical protein [Gemmatimonadaceae bacterium]
MKRFLWGIYARVAKPMCPHEESRWHATGEMYDGGEHYRCDICKRNVALIG